MTQPNPIESEAAEVRRKINQRLDFFTEPRHGERYLEALEDELVYLFQTLLNKARLETELEMLEHIKKRQNIFLDDCVLSRERNLARLKSDKDNNERE